MSDYGKTLLNIKEYYGDTLQTSADLKTSACCPAESVPHYIRNILKDIHPEILEQFYGCGSPIPLGLKVLRILDLGCGTGRDVYTLSKLVGPEGEVIGLDMTESQLETANQHLEYHTEKFGYDTPNVRFSHGYIEDLRSIGIEDNSIDLVVSNCVLNLSPEKKKVFSEIFRVLKPGGELYFSDVFSNRRIPQDLKEDPVLRGECLSGALYNHDFRRIMRSLGCLDYRIVSQAPIELLDPDIEERIGMIQFSSATVRAFKLETLEDICEDYGQVAIYKGSIPHAKNHFVLDDHHVFERNKPMLVCGNTASMLSETRFAEHFTIHGDRSVHYGEFACDETPSQDSAALGCC